MRKYECLYIISTQKVAQENLPEKINKYTALVEENKGTVESVNTDKFGEKKLAYPINYETEGYIVLMTFEGGSELPKELSRNLRNDEDILRFAVTKAAE